MAIKSNAAEHEKLSPFYVEHQRICQLWERIITGRGGECFGNYNAWSLIVNNNIRSQLGRHVYIKVKKATYTNEASFFVDHQAFQQTLIVIRKVNYFTSDSTIRKKHWTDHLKRFVGQKIARFPVLEGKVVVTDQVSELAERLNALALHLLELQVEQINYSAKNKELTIDLRTLLVEEIQLTHLLAIIDEL